MVCYSYLFQNFPQFIVNHTVKGFGIINKAEIDVFLELSSFFHDPADVAIWASLIISCRENLHLQLFQLHFTVTVLEAC